MSEIFLSYSHQDRLIADDMVAWLKDENHRSYFLDSDIERGITAGTRWENELYRQLNLCTIVIALVSPNWLNSKWCFAEIAIAPSLGKSVVFVKISDCDGMGLYPEIQQIDLRKL